MKPMLIFLGTILIFIGFFVVTLGMILPSEKTEKNIHEEDKKDIQYSGIVMIGPIPIVFGNSPGLMILSVLILLAMILWVFLFYMSVKIPK
ncbi:TIGR00304 family membrane protein [Methanotorris igneus]|uniref:TIGR00304 family protein n=1 Tax=Methanotorris igneus (strain DSM 5666 / JCM 11834 / Kol 5) TaxID=880724 RepID=F6BDJ3_METIK|nr:TIGR00304 family protein [Methanotorris igneus]AEF96554.1 protein of unknown function DUF131 [Methanotorris igneus Kol 5]